MELLKSIILGLVQGLSEFLPVSSSAHLILGSRLMNWEDQGLVFDVATHLGTLVAVLVYFRHELAGMLVSLTTTARSPKDERNRVLVGYLLLASIPALAVGALAHDLVELYLRDVRVIAVTTVLFGLVLWWSDVVGGKAGKIDSMSLRGAMTIGMAQALALIPGVSRSGITITAGRFLGLGPDEAARFSFLLAIPVIGAAGGYGALRVATGDAVIDWFQFGLAVAFAAVAGWLCIAAFLALLKRVGLLPFILYRLALGAMLFWVIL